MFCYYPNLLYTLLSTVFNSYSTQKTLRYIMQMIPLVSSRVAFRLSNGKGKGPTSNESSIKQTDRERGRERPKHKSVAFPPNLNALKCLT